MSDKTKFRIGVALVTLPMIALFTFIVVMAGWSGVLVILGAIAITAIIALGGYLIETY